MAPRVVSLVAVACAGMAIACARARDDSGLVPEAGHGGGGPGATDGGSSLPTDWEPSDAGGAPVGPPGCSPGPAGTPESFASACTSAVCLAFDECARVGICAGRPAPPDPTRPPEPLGPIPPLVRAQPAPAVPCADPSRPNIVYAMGSTAFPKLLQAVAPELAANDPPVVVVYQLQTSCRGVGALFDADPARRIIKDIPDNAAFFFNETREKVLCNLHPEGDRVDVGAADVFARTCGYDAKAGVADHHGPVQAVGFVVPVASSQRAISAEAARRVFGAGAASDVAPWTDPRLYFVQSSGAGTMQLVARAIQLPLSSFWGVDRLTAENLRDSMEAIDPAQAEKAIGVLAASFVDRANLRLLAFQPPGQACGYLPDSSPVAADKINVRDGHYPIWGPVHLFADTSNGAGSQLVNALVRRLTATRTDPVLLEAIIRTGVIPPCAMRVTRDQEMGPLASFQPEVGCGCFFDQVSNGGNACRRCIGASDCPGTQPACNYGYCEVR